MTTLAWVVGSGGLLGSHVARALAAAPAFRLWRPEGRPFPWEDPTPLKARLQDAIRAFLAAAREDPQGTWGIFWCAGSGVVGTSLAALAAESSTWELFLGLLGASVESGPARPSLGRVFLASSAGGLYAGSPERPLHEGSTPCPISPYGRAKLLQEQALEAFGQRHPQVSRLVGRISNLYGPGQKMDKPQGLISHMSRCLIHQQPVHIWVPLDTIRDYVFVQDAAQALVRWMERLGVEEGGAQRASAVVKICASERETTVATLLGVFRSLAKRRLKVVSGLNPAHTQQPARLQFRSRVWPDEAAPAATALAVGVNRVHRHQLALFQAGALPPPLPLRGMTAPPALERSPGA